MTCTLVVRDTICPHLWRVFPDPILEQVRAGISGSDAGVTISLYLALWVAAHFGGNLPYGPLCCLVFAGACILLSVGGRPMLLPFNPLALSTQ